MNVEELESIVRDELRRDAANTPSGGAVRTALLEAVADVSMTDRVARRWVVPLLVAAAVVALAAAATLLPRTLSGHDQPAHPKPSPSPSLPAAPSLDLHCAKGQQQVTGAGTRYSDAAGGLRYAYEYYCAAPDGSRTGSEIDAFRMVGGRLDYDQALLFRGNQQYVMSMTGTGGGLNVREYDANPGLSGHPGGVVSDVHMQVNADGMTGVGDPIAQPCLATDLTVQWTRANEPTPHPVLKLTNHSGKPCAVWGNPRYTQVAGQQRVRLRSVLRGPAGGLAAGEPSASPLLLQPGQSAYSAVGTEPVTGQCFVPTVSVALPNGVQLGTHESACVVVSYPLVRASNGSETQPESEAPVSATGSCLNSTALAIDFDSPQPEVAHRPGVRIVLTPLGSASCSITGYPDIRVLDKDGNLLQIGAQTPRGALGGLIGDQLPQVTVAPGHPASALAEWSTGPAGQHCDPPGRISFTLGGTTSSWGDSSGLVCDLQVHPFVPGSTGSG